MSGNCQAYHRYFAGIWRSLLAIFAFSISIFVALVTHSIRKLINEIIAYQRRQTNTIATRAKQQKYKIIAISHICSVVPILIIFPSHKTNKHCECQQIIIQGNHIEDPSGSFRDIHIVLRKSRRNCIYNSLLLCPSIMECWQIFVILGSSETIRKKFHPILKVDRVKAIFVWQKKSEIKFLT